MKNSVNDYVIRLATSAGQVDAAQWNALLALQSAATPFMRHEYLAAMESSRSAVPRTGWSAIWITLWQGDALHAGCVVYQKAHSYGEYVFDWAWANAYAEHGLDYYPKATLAPPFTPVPGSRLLASSADARAALLQAVLNLCQERKFSSLHVLFASADDLTACTQAGLMQRHTVQFHWSNRQALALPTPESIPTAAPQPAAQSTIQTAAQPNVIAAANREPSIPLREKALAGFKDFDDFLATLTQEKRKKIRQERRKVADAGVVFRHTQGGAISDADWDFFYRCYERTYWEHGNAPYLSRAFFRAMQTTMAENWLLFVAERNGQPIASSLIAIFQEPAMIPGTFPAQKIAYGRYWGALERVDCLHFEACYYQPLQWCIANGYQRFEGGAQGEHKMARALLPVQTSSAHWLAHPSFANAVERFLQREGQHIDAYMDELRQHLPTKAA